MRVTSSSCRHRLASLTSTTCAQCGMPLTLGTVGRHYGQRFIRWWQQNAVIACPWCRGAAPLYARSCPHCRQTITVQACLGTSLRPLHRRWQRRRPLPTRLTRALAQSAYLLGTLALLAWQFAAVTLNNPVLMGLRLALSAVILAVAALVSLWVLPRHLFAALSARLSPVHKVGLLANYLSVLLLLQAGIGGWLERSLLFVALLVCTWVAGRVLHRLLWPVTVGVRQIFREQDGGWFDPSQPQGRQGGYE